MTDRIRESFDWDWKFYKGDIQGAEKLEYDDAQWRTLNLPHDWSVEGEFEEKNPAGGDGGYLPTGIGWYRKYFELPHEWNDKLVTIQFDGIYMSAEVWINGKHLGLWPYGYTGFEYEVSPFLSKGRNVMAVRVDNADQPNSRWYTGSGIYRRTWLQAVERLHVDRYGVFVSSDHVSHEAADIYIRTSVVNRFDRTSRFTLRSEIIGPNGQRLVEIGTEAATGAGETVEIAQTAGLLNPVLWSVEQPKLHRLVTTVVKDGVVTDQIETTFGVRSANFDKDRGLLLNGQSVKIKGVCLHHDGGCVGAAVPRRVWERRLSILKEMGCNGIRMSHNPPDPELLDLCDEYGFLVMDEAFDEWLISKNKNGVNDYGYYQYFRDLAERDLKAMIRRDRNHPSIVLWSIGNEIPEQLTEDGYLVARMLVGICHQEDPTRPVTAACDNINAEPRPATEAFLKELDVIGYNYVNRWRTRTETFYGDDRHKNSHWKMIGSENTGIGGIRGLYELGENAGSRRSRMRRYNTSMITAEQLWKFTRMHDYVAGDFMWTGIDYIGETSWPHKNASFAPIDTCSFAKDGYYFYQSQWTDPPMVHIFPHWNWKGREGTVIPVICYTNCDSAELFVNCKSFGIKAYEFPRQGMSKEYGHYERDYRQVTTADLHLAWDVPYEPGILKVVGYTDGQAAVEQEIVTSGEPARIELTADRQTITADGRDVCHFTARVLDADGRFVPTADNNIRFVVKDEGTLIGTDNGQPDDHTPYGSALRHAFNGLALAVVQSTRDVGQITITADAEGLNGESIIIHSLAPIKEME